MQLDVDELALRARLSPADRELRDLVARLIAADSFTRATFIATLTPAETQALFFTWRAWARPSQLAPAGDWRFWLLLAGRGFGKTKSAAEYVRDEVAAARAGIIGLIGGDVGDVRDVMIEGPSGLLACTPKADRPQWIPSRRKLVWPNGAQALTFSSEDPEALRGPQHDLAWCLVAETPVRMADGTERPLIAVCVGDDVATRAGPRRVVASERTGTDAELWQLEASNGRVVVGTADHPVFADGRFTPLCDVAPGAILCGWQKRSSLKACPTSTTGETTLETHEGSSCIVSCGRDCEDPSQGPDGASTTSTATSSTIESKTSNALLESSMRSGMGNSDGQRGATRSGLPSPSRHGGRGHLSSALANGAGSHTEHEAHRADGAADAAPSAPLLRGITVKQVRKIDRRADVFNLSIDGAHEFFASDILVHNCDELAAWQYPADTFSNLDFGLRLSGPDGTRPRAVITTTPRPIKTLRELIKRSDTVVTRGSTFENARNLAPGALASLRKKYEGTRLGRQELDAELLEDTEGALWTLAMCEDALDLGRGMDVAYARRIVVAIDPSANEGGSDDEDLAEPGIIVAAEMPNESFLVLEDLSKPSSPNEWATIAVEAFKRWRADRIVAEANNGGAMITSTIRNVDPLVPVRLVHAATGKRARAEPVAALYERPRTRVGHARSFPKLEDQLRTFTGRKGERSPDRHDALVWAITDLMGQSGFADIAFDPSIGHASNPWG